MAANPSGNINGKQPKRPRFKRTIQTIALDHVHRNPLQPRQKFDPGELDKLALSIEEEGLIQLTTVRPDYANPGNFIIVAGERRYHGVKRAGYDEYEFIVLEVTGAKFTDDFVLSVIENLHRIDLNPIEEAKACKRMNEELHLSWGEISNITGREKGTIENKIKLLDLPLEIQQLVIDDKLPQGNAIFLTSFKGERGYQVRMAMAFAMGKDPIDLGIGPLDTSHDGKGSRVRIPPTSDRQLRRMLKFSWSAKPEILVMKAFLDSPVEEQIKGCKGTVSTALMKFRATMRDLEVTARAINDFFDANKIVGVSEDYVLDRAVQDFRDREKRSTKSRRLTDEEIIARAGDYGSNGNGGQRAVGELPLPASFNLEELVLAKRALESMFPSNGSINLDVGSLATTLQKTTDNAQATAQWAFRVAGSHWREPLPAEPGAKRELVQLVTRMRVMHGGSRLIRDSSSFGGFLHNLKNHPRYGLSRSIDVDALYK